MFKFKAYINTSRYLFLSAGILGTLLTLPLLKYPFFIFLSLMLFTNSQLRVVYLKNNLLILSIFIEILSAAFFGHLYGGYLYLILFSTLMDSVFYLKSESYLVSFLSGIAFSYITISLNNIYIAAVLILFYISEFLLLLQLKEELSIRTDTEVLYDQIRKNNYELQTAQSRLLEYSKQVEKITQLEERNRISREIHDSLGHNLTGTLMQVDACIQIMEIDKDKGMKLLNSIYGNISQSIEMVRQTVQELRPAFYENYSSAIDNLINKFKSDTGTNIHLATSGVPYKLYPSVETVLFKNIQEALTNSVRHGKSKNIYLDFIYKSDMFELVIKDDGSGSEKIKKGFGISGMEERLQLIGGKMSVENSEGFKITMTIPVEGV